MFGFRSFTTCLSLLAATLISAAPSAPPSSDAGSSLSLVDRSSDDNATSSDSKLVFCHFMMGIISSRTGSADYDSDMKMARELGIDAFALNIGNDEYTDTQLGYAYESAANNDMKVFLSFDFNYFDRSTDAAKVGQMIANYSSMAAQLTVDGKVFASSFVGDGLDVSAVRSAAGMDVFWAPNFSPSETSEASDLDGALNWMGWDSNGNNKAPSSTSNVTVQEGDASYKSWLATKSYIAPVSPWFSTHYGAEVSYSKNFVLPGDLLWYSRWNDVLSDSPRFVEIITWNDYGESHYIGPLSSKHVDDGASKWANDMPHNGFRDLAKPYIAAYKAGATAVDDQITEDQVIYWYRPTLSTAECDSTDNTMGSADNSSGNYFHGKPNGYGNLEDAVFVVTLLTEDAQLSVTSGGNTQTFDAIAGANAFKVDMEAGQQKFSVTRNSKTILSGTSLKEVRDECICGIYNFNTYVGTLPEGDSDALEGDGFASFTVGLSVSTCSPTASLGTASTAASTTGEGSSSTPATAVGASATDATSATPRSSSTMSRTTTASSTFRTVTATSQTQQPSASSTSTPTSTSIATSSSSSSSSSSTSNSSCNAGTTAEGQSDNLSGLCSFACARGYCPDGPCTCTSTGTPASSTETGQIGCPKDGEGDTYEGLCKFSCNLGYCPDAACSTDCS